MPMRAPPGGQQRKSQADQEAAARDDKMRASAAKQLRAEELQNTSRNHLGEVYDLPPTKHSVSSQSLPSGATPPSISFDMSCTSPERKFYSDVEETERSQAGMDTTFSKMEEAHRESTKTTLNLIEKELHITHRIALAMERSGLFRVLVNITIILNAIQLGASIELTTESWNLVWVVSDNVFTTIFLLEFMVKYWAYRWDYFLNRWNLLDFGLVIVGILDTWVFPLLDSSTNITRNIAIFRALRLVRLFRILKVLRVQRELEILVEGIASALRSMFWISILLTLVLYVFGILFTVVIGEETYPPQGGPMGMPFDAEIYFGTVIRSMLSLFNMILLAEWQQVIRPVFEQQPYIVPLFVLICVMLSFGVLNVIVGVIVDSTMTAARRQDDDDVNKYRAHQMGVARQLADMMDDLDVNQDHLITPDEMAEAANKPEFIQELSQIELPKGFDLQDLYLMLDANVDFKLTRKEFVDGLYRHTYSNDFQRLCLMQLSVAQVKKMLLQVRDGLHLEIHNAFSMLTSDIADLRLQHGLPARRAPPPCAPTPLDCSSQGYDISGLANGADAREPTITGIWQPIGPPPPVAKRRLGNGDINEVVARVIAEQARGSEDTFGTESLGTTLIQGDSSSADVVPADAARPDGFGTPQVPEECSDALVPASAQRMGTAKERGRHEFSSPGSLALPVTPRALVAQREANALKVAR